jgi:hypothetical protein
MYSFSFFSSFDTQMPAADWNMKDPQKIKIKLFISLFIYTKTD